MLMTGIYSLCTLYTHCTQSWHIMMTLQEAAQTHAHRSIINLSLISAIKKFILNHLSSSFVRSRYFLISRYIYTKKPQDRNFLNGKFYFLYKPTIITLNHTDLSVYISNRHKYIKISQASYIAKISISKNPSAHISSV